MRSVPDYPAAAMTIHSHTTGGSSYSIVLPPAPKPLSSPLRRLQVRLQRGRLFLLGNLVSDLRYWLWRLCR